MIADVVGAEEEEGVTSIAESSSESAVEGGIWVMVSEARDAGSTAADVSACVSGCLAPEDAVTAVMEVEEVD